MTVMTWKICLAEQHKKTRKRVAVEYTMLERPQYWMPCVSLTKSGSLLIQHNVLKEIIFYIDGGKQQFILLILWMSWIFWTLLQGVQGRACCSQHYLFSRRTGRRHSCHCHGHYCTKSTNHRCFNKSTGHSCHSSRHNPMKKATAASSTDDECPEAAIDMELSESIGETTTQTADCWKNSGKAQQRWLVPSGIWRVHWMWRRQSVRQSPIAPSSKELDINGRSPPCYWGWVEALASDDGVVIAKVVGSWFFLVKNIVHLTVPGI